jgi:hypothetical protein
VIYEQSTETNRYIGSMVDLVTAFEFGLAALIAGLEERLRDQAGASSKIDFSSV